MEEGNKKVLFWTILAGAGWGVALAHKNKKRTVDYFTGAIGGSLAGAFAGMLINRFKKKPTNEEQKLIENSKFSEIKIQRNQ